MAGMRVFVSSTCYDMRVIRSQLRGFLTGMGYTPVMSDYSDVVYDPRVHTHSSCLQEVAGCDMVILVIGSRFGGQAVPEAMSSIDLETLQDSGVNLEKIKHRECLSITQYEVLKAIEQSVPVFTFIEEHVLHDHNVYERNKDNKNLNSIVFPSIDKPATAKYIFEFINLLRSRSEGNNFYSFSKMDDIETNLRKQWAGIFQRLLYEQRSRTNESRRIDAMTEQLEDLKTAILATIESADSKEIARGVVRFRRLVDFTKKLRLSNPALIVESNCPWMEFLELAEIDRVEPIPQKPGDRRFRSRTALVKTDGTFYETRYSPELIHELGIQWDAFSAMPTENRRVIFDALAETERGLHPDFLVYRDKSFEQEHGTDSEDEAFEPWKIEETPF